jgi:PAS domain S-box-containing protein
MADEAQYAVIQNDGCVLMASAGLAAAADRLGLSLAAGRNFFDAAPKAGNPAVVSIQGQVRRVLSGDSTAWSAGFPALSGAPAEIRVAVSAAAASGQRRGAIVSLLAIERSGDANDDLLFQASLLKFVSDAVIATDLDGNITHWNDAAERIYRWPRAEVLGRNVMEILVPEEERDRARGAMETLSADGHWRGEMRLQRKDGSTFSGFVADSVVRGGNGQLMGFVGVSSDISERKRERQDLEQTRESLLLALYAAGMVAWEWTTADDSAQWFGDLENVLGDPAGVPTGDAFFAMVHPEDRAAAELAARESLDRRSPYSAEFRLCRPDGAVRWCSAQGRVTVDENGEPVLTGVMLDITARRQAHQQLRVSEEKYRFLADALPQFVWTANAAGEVDFCNQHWFDFTGLGVKETLDRGWYAALHPDDRERVVEQARVSTERGVPFQTEFRVWRASDQSYRWHLARARTFRNVDGNVRWVGTAIDIQDRKQAEEELTRQAQELSRSNADLQQFAYVTSHDLQEPLRIIHSYAQLLQQRYRGRLDQDADEFIGFITTAVRRMEALIQDLLSYSRVVNVDSLPMAEVEMDGTVHWAMMNLHAAIQESNANIRFTDLPTVTGSQVQLVQLLQNLLSNAIKYRGAAAPAVEITAAPDGRMWTFTIRDNGIGIDPQYHDRIFGIFKRLHGRDIPGTGIGLAICEKIIQKHGGRIWVESEAGRGAAFRFTLPAAGEDS